MLRVPAPENDAAHAAVGNRSPSGLPATVQRQRQTAARETAQSTVSATWVEASDMLHPFEQERHEKPAWASLTTTSFLRNRSIEFQPQKYRKRLPTVEEFLPIVMLSCCSDDQY